MPPQRALAVCLGMQASNPDDDMQASNPDDDMQSSNADDDMQSSNADDDMQSSNADDDAYESDDTDDGIQELPFKLGFAWYDTVPQHPEAGGRGEVYNNDDLPAHITFPDPLTITHAGNNDQGVQVFNVVYHHRSPHRFIVPVVQSKNDTILCDVFNINLCAVDGEEDIFDCEHMRNFMIPPNLTYRLNRRWLQNTNVWWWRFGTAAKGFSYRIMIDKGEDAEGLRFPAMYHVYWWL